jgi:hypothetical protein
MHGLSRYPVLACNSDFVQPRHSSAEAERATSSALLAQWMGNLEPCLAGFDPKSNRPYHLD